MPILPVTSMYILMLMSEDIQKIRDILNDVHLPTPAKIERIRVHLDTIDALISQEGVTHLSEPKADTYTITSNTTSS